MPQLFPMNWHMLVLFFLFTFMLSSLLIYFTYLPEIKIAYFKMSTIQKSWKW
nr:ATP synthase F0 subunit 8 [Alectorobius amblus]